jgi:hypothetical protein
MESTSQGHEQAGGHAHGAIRRMMRARRCRIPRAAGRATRAQASPRKGRAALRFENARAACGRHRTRVGERWLARERALTMLPSAAMGGIVVNAPCRRPGSASHSRTQPPRHEGPARGAADSARPQRRLAGGVARRGKWRPAVGARWWPPPGSRTPCACGPPAVSPPRPTPSASPALAEDSGGCGAAR